ncbi:G-type lectin S-receptor-like serine/threonine-protein kinase LECRK1 [Dioscorea cayenensis subsp. rotundata]|uniref:Receptor-like serine/threonine-protein kinase n=1 Tax=Dioscorea cayennensis subsp. rotundata TaxID=55577 RepID=A0AB40CCW6_DIOCR|nr:G-type lectin S-receptor-like serine/threonine-protein kinase LECRK1 [Dioscorea cayenensis subsp. rotundata]
MRFLSDHLLLLLLPLLFSSLASSQKNQNISLGSTITTSGTTTSWLSPSGDFAFGFLPLPINASLFILAIYFAKTNEKTIAWYLKDINSPLLSDSKLYLTSDGQLLLTDLNNKTIWNPFPSSGSSYVAILDTGNLILAAADSTPNWQSFDFPTDTILPTQPLYKNNKLRSHLYDDNYTYGRFELLMQVDGNLVLYPLALLTDSSNNYGAYWSTMTVGSGNHLMFDVSGTLYLELENKTHINVTASNLSTDEFYQRVTLDTDGSLRHYVYPKDAAKNSSWKYEWTVIATVPSDICRSLYDDTGSGACGFNSYCHLDQNLGQSCKCPPSFSFVDTDDMYKGCKPDFVAPSCGDGGGVDQVYDLIEMANTDWPGSDYEYYASFDEDQCRKNCLNDCFCAVAIFRGTDCWKKRLPLSNGRTGNDIGGKALIKVGTTNSSTLDSMRQQIEDKRKGRKVWLVVGLSSLIVSLFILLGSVMVVVMVLSSFSSNYKRIQVDSNITGSTLRCFTYKELEEATNGFRKELGSGAFGTVYEGFLPPNPKTCVAVKKLENMLKEKEKEFMAEVRSIGQTHHKNLVRLFGYCDEGTNRLLVYEFMSNGSLTNFLFGERRPSWNKRVEIVLGIARGLLYLHEECSTSIIHCDIKLQNILLDDEVTARISDFGLAKLLKPNQTRTNTGIRGTKGYVAPEWFRNVAITTKVDVYSFGVMLLEIICCRKNLELELNNEDETVLVYWAYDCYKGGRVDILIANDEEAAVDFEDFLRLLMVAIWCIQEDPSQRPTMRRVNQMLDCTIVVNPPPDPFFNKVINS